MLPSVFLVIWLASVRATWQQTQLAAIYDQPVTYLNASRGPYVAEHDVTVLKHARLVIEAGTVLQFGKGRELTVFGVLDARGNATHRIRFTKKNDGGGGGGGEGLGPLERERKFRLVAGNTIQDGNLQVYYNGKWNYVCSTEFK